MSEWEGVYSAGPVPVGSEFGAVEVGFLAVQVCDLCPGFPVHQGAISLLLNVDLFYRGFP